MRPDARRSSANAVAREVALAVAFAHVEILFQAPSGRAHHTSTAFGPPSVQVILLPLDGRKLAAATTIANKIACKKFKQNCSFGRQFKQFCILFDAAAESSPCISAKALYGLIGICPLAIGERALWSVHGSRRR